MTLWELLGVPHTCTVDEMKAAWRRKCKELHPDVNGGDPKKTALFINAKPVYESTLKEKIELESEYAKLRKNVHYQAPLVSKKAPKFWTPGEWRKFWNEGTTKKGA